MRRLKITYTQNNGERYQVSLPAMKDFTNEEIQSAATNWVEKVNRGEIRKVQITVWGKE